MQRDSKLATEIIDLLIYIPIFDTLDPDELRVVVKYMNFVEVKARDVIFREGEKGDYVCFVANGTLDVVKANEAGSLVVISTLHKGRSIGEMAILDNHPRSASVKARDRRHPGHPVAERFRQPAGRAAPNRNQGPQGAGPPAQPQSAQDLQPAGRLHAAGDMSAPCPPI
jgi:hypothetical protein